MSDSDTLSIQQRGICVELLGELDTLSGPRITQSLLRVALRTQRLELDLSGVTFIDACGLRALLWLKRAVPTMQIVAMSPQVERILTITETYDLLVATGLSDTG
jgi:anti-anti-sigma factor